MVPNKKQLTNDLSYYNDVIEALEHNKTANLNEPIDCPMCGVEFRRENLLQKYCTQRCGKHFADLREKLKKYGMVK
jgi:transposase-like protein